MDNENDSPSVSSRKPRKSIGPISGLLGSITGIAAVSLIGFGALLARTALTDSRLQGSPVWMILAVGAVMIFYGLCLLVGAAVMLRPRSREPAQESRPSGTGPGARKQPRYKLHRGSWTSIAIFSFFVLVAWSISQLLDSEPDGPWMIVEEPFTEHRASGWPRDLFANWYGTAYCTDGSIAFEGYIDGRGNILGEGKWYYPDGTLQASGTFRDGKLIGGFRRFDESGALVEKIGKVAEERRSGSLH